MNKVLYVLGYIPKVVCIAILPLTLGFDLITGFKYKETKGLWEFIFK